MLDFSMPILVVEDMALMGRIIRGLLKQIGFQRVDVVNGSYTALQRLRSSRYRLIISDWEMRPMTGLDLLKQVRSEAALAETRFIMMTGSSTLDHVVAAKNAGADDFIAKPFTAQVLKEKISHLFAGGKVRNDTHVIALID